MPEFTYVGEDARTYPDLRLDAVPGQTYDLPDAPDHRFTPTEPTSKPKKSEQE